MHNSQLLRSTTAALIALTLVACGSDGNGSAGGNNGNAGGNNGSAGGNNENAGGNNGAGGSSTLAAVSPEPAGENCASGGKRIDEGTDTNGNSVLDASEITDTQYVCNSVPPDTYTIGVTVAGLNGSVVLQNNADTLLTLHASGSFSFDLPIIGGEAYALSVHTQPPGQTCTVANGSGIATANVTNVQVTCTTHPLEVVSITPAPAATDAERTISLSMVFSAALDAATVTPANVTLMSTAGDHPITLSVSGTQLTVTPTRQLLPATTYTFRATTGVRGIHGEQLASAASASFTTRDGQWRTAVLAETDDVDVRQPYIAVDVNGNALLVWSGLHPFIGKIWSNRATPDGRWSTPVAIHSEEGAAQSRPHVAMDADGNALAVWLHTTLLATDVWANRYTAGIGWGTSTPIQTGETNASKPTVAFDAAGNALAVWERGSFWSNSYVAGSGWGTPELIETSPAGGGMPPQLAMHANGNAVAVWVQGSRVWANHFTVGEGWGTPVLIESDDTGSATSPDVTLDDDGNALAVWKQNGGIGSNRATPDGQWGAPTLVTAEGTDVGAPRVAMNKKGNAFAVWQQYQEGVYTIWSNRYTSEGGWGTAERIQSEVVGHDAHDPRIVVDAAGNALAVWYAQNEIYYNRYINGRGWGTSAAIDNTAGELTIAIDAAGNATMAWTRFNGTHNDIYARRFD